MVNNPSIRTTNLAPSEQSVDVRPSNDPETKSTTAEKLPAHRRWRKSKARGSNAAKHASPLTGQVDGSSSPKLQECGSGVGGESPEDLINKDLSKQHGHMMQGNKGESSIHKDKPDPEQQKQNASKHSKLRGRGRKLGRSQQTHEQDNEAQK